MKPKIQSLIIIGVSLAFLMAPSAGAISSKAGTTAYTFLKIGTGARSQALGGAFVGLADDATALYYNPAGLTAFGQNEMLYDELLEKTISSTPRNRFVASYINYLVDFQYGFLGFTRQIDSTSAAGASISYQNYGTFKRLDSEGEQNGTFGASDFSFGLTYSKKMSRKISGGLTGKFIYEKIESYSSTGLAADLGLMYLVNDEGTSRLGLALTNFGAQLQGLTKEHKDPLPTKISAGFSSHLRGLPLIFASEIGKPFDNDFYFSLGAELVSFKPFFVRLGWTSASKEYRVGTDQDLMAGFAGGFGLIYRQYNIDYSYSSYADLGAVHRISLGAGF